MSPWLACGLVTLGVLTRVLPHPPNLTLATALALFAGSFCTSRATVAIPLAAMVVSDLILGMHELVAFTWGGVVLTWLLGRWLRRRQSAGRVALAAAAGSTLYFLLTNIGVWLFADGSTAYPKTVDGLVHCFVMALPFYRTALLGDLIYTAALFGLWQLAAARLIPAPARSR
jgi:hypothetical protein